MPPMPQGVAKLDVMMAHNRIEKRWESFLLKQYQYR